MEELKKPIGWPKDEPFPTPTIEEVEKAVQEGEDLIIEMTEELKDKVSGPTPEMLQALIDI